MSKEQLSEFNQLMALQQKLTTSWVHYWHKYSSFNDWHFWFMVALFVLPLVALYFFIDRRRIFHIGFFGFSIHVWNTYADIIGVELGKWHYPHKVIPVLPIGFSMDLSFVPVLFMFVYQWTLNHKKNYYLYALLPSAFLAFIVKPLYVAIHLTKPGPTGGGWKAYLTLFITHLMIAYVSKWLSDLFRKYHEKAAPTKNRQDRQSKLVLPSPSLLKGILKRGKIR